MLSTETELAKKVVLSERPVINEDQVAFEPALLENLIQNISMVSSIFHKQAESLIPKVTVAVAKRVPEEDDEEVTSPPSSNNDTQIKDDHKTKEESKTKEGDKKLKEIPKKKIEIPKPGTKVNPNKDTDNKSAPKISNLIDLLDDIPIETKPITVMTNKPNNGGDLLDFLESPVKQVSQTINSNNNSSSLIDFNSAPQKIDNPSAIFQNVINFESATPVPYEVKYFINLLLTTHRLFSKKALQDQ